MLPISPSLSLPISSRPLKVEVNRLTAFRGCGIAPIISPCVDLAIPVAIPAIDLLPVMLVPLAGSGFVHFWTVGVDEVDETEDVGLEEEGWEEVVLMS